ncbi:MAG: hypothetical protein OEY64_02110 [Nitrospinota bacterium]|nr:hypothetical protein [Nitrospinota bacterium]
MKEAILNIIPGSPVLSALIFIIVLDIVLYMARKPVHRGIKSISFILKNAMRITSHSVLLAENQLQKRNRDVLLAAGIDATERLMEREFRRVEETLKRDLEGYPAIQRNMAELIAKIDEDYRISTEVPPSPPEWVKVVQSVSIIPASDTMVARMLGEIRSTLIQQEKNALSTYRESTSKRHSMLRKMMPYWRKLSETLAHVDASISGILKRSSHIDRQIQDFEDIRKGSEKAVRTLSSSSMTQFTISGLVLLIALGGAMVNFNLIALPMSEMVGGASFIGPFKVSSISAMVIILVESAMGLFLMESFRITRLFPIIASMDDKLRRRIMVAAFILLFVLASVESSLAFMRDRIAADIQSLRSALTGLEPQEPTQASWIPMVGQMVMGFILPFALMFVAIPLESFIHSSRTVLGVVLAWLLRAFAYLLRLFGNIVKSFADFVMAAYDLFIFPPLWLEDLVKGNKVESDNSDIGSDPEVIKDVITFKDENSVSAEKNDEDGDDTGVFETVKKGKNDKK